MWNVSSAIACICNIRPPACYEYWRTETLFLGTVSSVIQPDASSFESVLIDVSENFRGMDSDNARTFNYDHSCAHSFEKGETYLFYGIPEKEDSRQFGTGLCTRTAEVEHASDDLEYLRAVKEGESLYWIWGTISEIGYEPPMSGIRAEVLGSHPKLEGVSDNNGNIKFDVGSPGRYRVRVHLPEGRSDINFLSRNDLELWEENRKQIVGGKFGGNQPYVDYELDVKANRCGWFDVSIPRREVNK